MAATPERMCRVCRQHKSKSELQRWVIQDWRLVVDSHQAFPGRGYYVCDLEHCRQTLPKTLSRYLASPSTSADAQ